ncbi:hypothetical protein KAI87_12885, partial [Myxococcota bacterium]|nr:hypothetical protein [Myxococcota bacterium]
ENFIIGHLAEIEAYILERMGGVLPDCDELDRCFKRLIAEDLGGKMNMVSFDIPFDNLLQTRDVCYHLHNKQKLGNKKLPYALIHIEWAQDYGESWRRNQTLRHRYFYEKESEYYRNLFLLLVRRQKHHLESFVDKWGERLQFSLQNRKNLSKLLLVIENEMDTFSPNFKNPEGFRKHIRMMSRSIIADVSRLTPYLQFVEDQSIYLNTET